MCLILFSIDGPGHLLTVAANRDEFYSRPTAKAAFWADHPEILAGRDLSAGGTWMGINRNGRFAAVTNFREPAPDPLPPRSRGALTRDFLVGSMQPETYLEGIDRDADEYRGFNLVIGDARGFYYYSNRAREVIALRSGTYGLSNQLLNCTWPKVVDGRTRLAELLSDSNCDADPLFDLIGDSGGTSQPFSAPFISSVEYGTCASTVLSVTKDGTVCFEERSFGVNGKVGDTAKFSFQLPEYAA